MTDDEVMRRSARPSATTCSPPRSLVIVGQSSIRSGNLTDDPELRFTSNGVAVANFRLAVTPRVRHADQWTDAGT